MSQQPLPQQPNGQVNVALITTAGTIIVAIIGGLFLLPSKTNPPPTPTPIPILTPTSSLSTLQPTAVATVSPNASWLISPVEAHFGAEVPNDTITLTLNPGEILSLTTSVGTFMAQRASGLLVPIQLKGANGKAYVLIWEGNGSASETVKITGVPSGNMDWERRHPPAGTPWLSAAMAVEKRVASGMMMSPNCGNGCTTVSYYILNSDLQIVQTSEQ